MIGPQPLDHGVLYTGVTDLLGVEGARRPTRANGLRRPHCRPGREVNVVALAVARSLAHVRRAVLVGQGLAELCHASRVGELQVPDPHIGAAPLVLQTVIRLAEAVVLEAVADGKEADMHAAGWSVAGNDVVLGKGRGGR
jgi:hypothetical protein